MNMDPSDTDPDMALEIAVQNLEIGGFGSDSEAEEVETTETERSEDPPGNLLEEEQEGSRLTREGIARLYSPSPAPSNAPSTVSDSSQRRRQVTLATIVEDQSLFSLFRRFLKDQCTTRNLNFWLACEHYRKLVPGPSEGQQYLYEVAKAIYIKFIKGSATQRVTLLEQTKKQIKMGLDLKQRVTPDLFATAQKEIWGVMNKNEFRQFLVSGMFQDCPSFANIADNISLTTSVYTPSMANPALNVCGGGSLQHSGSEDSASLSSFSTESDMGPRSCLMQLSRPFPTAARNAISDCEDHKPRHRRGGRHSSAHVTKDKAVTEERFAALLQDRLTAVIKDREAMTKRVRDRARQQKKEYEEIMALEWFDLPEAIKYVQYEEPATMGSQESSNQLQVPGPKPSSTSPHANSSKDLNHINGFALREVQAALKDMEITNQVTESRRPFSRTSGCSSSVLSTNSDSGVGDTFAQSGLGTPKEDRLTAFLFHQNTLSGRTSERERDARAAAMSLIHGSPQPESLNPRVPPGIRGHPTAERQGRRPYSNYPEAYSSDDSSSCITMTSHSSASDLFIPRRYPPRPAYSDNDDSHAYGRIHGRRTMNAPRRSKPSHMAPSPIVEHQQLATPTSSLSAPPIKSKGHSGQTLVVYHLDAIPTPFAMKLGGNNITLRDFKDKVLKRTGNFRFFFKSYLEDVGEFLEECSDESMVLPLFQGKIIGRVERID